MEQSAEKNEAKQAALSRIAALRNSNAHYLVYRFTSPNGKIYIGMTGNKAKRRWANTYRGNLDLYQDFKILGKENFKKEVLCENMTKEGAEHLEYELIERLHARDPAIGYNCFTGGARKNALPAPRSILRLKESKRKLYETTDCCRRISKAKTKYYVEHPEMRARLSDIGRNLYATRQDLVTACRLRSKAPKPLRCIETGEAFPSIRAASQAMQINRTSLRYALRNPKTVCCGYHWEPDPGNGTEDNGRTDNKKALPGNRREPKEI